jgi:hypothetical protein
VRVVRIAGAAYNGYVASSELLQLVLERDDLSRANEGEVKGIEKENYFLVADELLQREIFYDIKVYHCGSVEGRGFFADKYCHFIVDLKG